jgi:hypothetical protein
MTSFFNSNANALSRSVVGVTQNAVNSANIESAKDYFRFQSLNESVLNQLKIDIGYFSKGQFNNLINSFTQQNYNEFFFKTNADIYYNADIDVVSNLNKLVRDPNTFRNYTTLLRNILSGLQQVQDLQKINNDLRSDLSNNQFGEGIIDEKIIYNFLINRRGEFVPFEESVLYTQDLDIKLWYSNYLQEHGPPPNGVFDVDKLSTIVDRLIAEGVITFEDFLREETYSL